LKGDLTTTRKAEHISICLNQDVSYKTIKTGFEQIQLTHCALPEINFEEINPQISFLGKTLSFPLMITGMTGGFEGAQTFNQQVAEVCQAMQIAFGLGSLRPALENPELLNSFQIAPHLRKQIPIMANIGAAQIIREEPRQRIQQLVEQLEVDALAVHLNPLQEILQPEGDQHFRGVLNGIEQLVKKMTIPIVVKETGAGISRKVAERLIGVGVSIIDVSGAGGTSWAAVEHFRVQDQALAARFWDWGIPTVQCLQELSSFTQLQVIASGGIRSGLDVAKACVLGAHLAGAALPFLKALYQQGQAGLLQLIQQWRQEFKITMFLTGCTRVSELDQVAYHGNQSQDLKNLQSQLG